MYLDKNWISFCSKFQLEHLPSTLRSFVWLVGNLCEKAQEFWAFELFLKHLAFCIGTDLWVLRFASPNDLWTKRKSWTSIFFRLFQGAGWKGGSFLTQNLFFQGRCICFEFRCLRLNCGPDIIRRKINRQTNLLQFYVLLSRIYQFTTVWFPSTFPEFFTLSTCHFWLPTIQPRTLHALRESQQLTYFLFEKEVRLGMAGAVDTLLLSSLWSVVNSWS